MTLHLDRPWLEMDLSGPHRVLSWALNAPGYVTASRIIWREVRNSDLPADLDVRDWLHGELARRGALDGVVMLTARNLDAYQVAETTVEGIHARCVATAGLSNAERIGTRMDRRGHDWGTINLAVQLSQPLSDAALLEALSIATQARTAAVIDARWHLPTGLATGTGTDCVAIAAPVAAPVASTVPAPAGAASFAGLHTPVGEALGRVVYQAIHTGVRTWINQNRHRAHTSQGMSE
ncbi:adenosylcobinamide amidohydrolase [Profundibacter sp.]